MGFGGDTKDSTKSFTPNPAVAGAATSNINYAQNLENSSFSPYTGNQVADFGPLQQQSITAAGGPAVSNAIQNFAGAPAGSVNPQTISSQMDPYMNQYVNMALNPQLLAQQHQFDTQNNRLDAAATSSGAFGDARAGIEAANLTENQNAARTGLIGSAYNSAFNTAIGAGAQDVSNNLQGQTTNANLQETANNRQLQGAEALQGNQGFQNTIGQQQTAQTQAGLNAQYNQWLMAKQDPYQKIQAMNSAIGAGATAMPATQTTSSPDNSGYGMVGSLLGTAAGAFLGGPAGASIGGSLGGSIGNMFGGSSTAPSTPDGGAGFGVNGQQLPGNFTPQSPNGYADGGQPPVGKASVVGERGPELFIPHEPGTIIPHEAVAAAAGAPGGFSQAFGGKATVHRKKAMKSKAPAMRPMAANNNMAGAFGAAA